MKLWTVDSFTKLPFKGNPAGVVVEDDDLFTNESKYLQISAEINLSETSFIKPLSTGQKRNHYQIRWFTPKTEVKLCGHGTLAAAHILFTENPFASITGREIIFESLSGPLHVVKSEEGRYTLDFPLQRIGETLKLTKHILEIFGDNVITNIVQSSDAIIVEVNSVDYLKKKTFDIAKIEKNIDARGVIVTAAALVNDDTYDFYSRYFAPRSGIMEDPVTGSAHCKLADYWNKKLGKVEFKAYQASARGGELDLKINGDRVYITGSAVTMLTATLAL